MAPPAPGILDLSNELLRDILDFLEADPDKLVSLDRRAYLSQESFRPPPAPLPDQTQVVGSFRLVCRRFSDLGAIHQFARLATLFSRPGFERLHHIASRPHLARHVKKFSYKVPYFCTASSAHPQLPDSIPKSRRDRFWSRVHDQHEIIKSGDDLRALKAALSAFTSLQHVQILRVQDEDAREIIEYNQYHPDQPFQVLLEWEPACSHGTRTLGAALLESQSPCSRFSSPQLSPRSAEMLAVNTPRSFVSLASRLTSLELHFVEGHDLNRDMSELSELFRKICQAAVNMQAIHIGFPHHRPLSLPLEDIFHHVTWDRLAAFGIQAWKLDADEICGLVGRHRERLRGLRLRDVYLNEGSKWKDVLGYLRAECPRLEWVSLRRIGYSRHLDEQSALVGAEVDDTLFETLSISDSDDDLADLDSANGHSDSSVPDDGDEAVSSDDDSMITADHSYGHASATAVPLSTPVAPAYDSADNSADDSTDDDDSDNDSDRGPRAHSMAFPAAALRSEPAPLWEDCDCAPDLLSPDDLGDNGQFVPNAQRKLWEKWVVRHHHCTQEAPASHT